MNRYERALINADAAGDYEAARVIAAKIREMRQADPSAGGGYLRPFGMDEIPFIGPVKTPQGMDRFLSGAGKFMSDQVSGAEQFVRSAIPGESEREKELQQQINETERRDAPLMDTRAGTLGNIAGGVATFAPTAFIPGANTYAGSALIGSSLGATQPTTEEQSRTINTIGGGLGGLAGRAISGGISRFLSPHTRPEVMALRREGVVPTPGQILGGGAQRIEEGMTSVPVMGDFIRGAQKRSVEQFNKATLNKIAAPLGKTVSKIGREGIEEAGGIVDDAYKVILPKLSARLDDAFVGDLKAISQSAQELAEPQQRRFGEIIKNKITNRLGDRKEIAGRTLKEIDSELGRLSREYKKSLDVDVRDLGSRLSDLKQAFRSMISRTTPEGAKELAKADLAYATLLRVEDAASRAGSKEGIFSPAALRAGAKKFDSSMRSRKFSRGNAMLQDFAEAGEKVLGSTVPDSGTPFRAANALWLGGGYAIDPSLAMSMGGAAGMYTQPMQNVMALALSSRPQSVRAAGQAISRLNPYAAALLTPWVVNE